MKSKSPKVASTGQSNTRLLVPGSNTGSTLLKPDLSKAQLFLDDTLIDDHGRVSRFWHQAHKHAQPVLVPEHPWEGSCPVMFGTVLHRQGRYHMWYMNSSPARKRMVCYAVSEDGLHWEKPRLGLIDYEGSKANNLCMAPVHHDYIDDVSIIDDPQDSDWPLKALFWEGDGSGNPNTGLRAARSRDGCRWEILPGFVLELGDRFNAMPHRENGKFVVFGRVNSTYLGHKGPYRKDRLVFRTESEDLVHWTQPLLVNQPDLNDPPAMRFYSQTAFHYQGQRLGFIERMHVSPDVLDPELTWSHDGLHWHRSLGRQPFIQRGQLGSWDGNWLCLGTAGPLKMGKTLAFYYSGRSGCHAAAYPVVGAIGLATLRPDGFASIDAHDEPGYLQLKILRWTGGDLLLNVDTRRDDQAHPRHWTGWVKAEICDQNNKPIPGFTRDLCLPITTNSQRESATCYLPMRWEKNMSMNKLAGKPVRICLHMKDARVYSFKA